MKARRIGNGKGVDAIANVIASIESYKSAKSNMINESVTDNKAFFKYISVARIASKDTSDFINDIASGKIDDGDIMDYIIESKDKGFMDEVESIRRDSAIAVHVIDD